MEKTGCSYMCKNYDKRLILNGGDRYRDRLAIICKANNDGQVMTEDGLAPDGTAYSFQGRQRPILLGEESYANCISPENRDLIPDKRDFWTIIMEEDITRPIPVEAVAVVNKNWQEFGMCGVRIRS